MEYTMTFEVYVLGKDFITQPKQKLTLLNPSKICLQFWKF